jgi:hypothetical protein
MNDVKTTLTTGIKDCYEMGARMGVSLNLSLSLGFFLIFISFSKNERSLLFLSSCNYFSSYRSSEVSMSGLYLKHFHKKAGS